MPYLGSWKVDDLLTFPAITHRFDTGALTDADAVPAFRIYEDETGTAILTGNMAKLDDANTTGFYSEQITLSAANGFEKGKCYTVYITAAVNSVTGGQHHTFQIEAEVDANTVSGGVNVAQFGGTNGTFSSGRPEVNTSHAAGTAWNSGAIGAATLASDTISAAKIATGAITSSKFAASAIDAAAIASNAIAAAKIASGAITNAKFASGAIDATAIATGAITNAKFAAGAIDAAAIAADAIGASELASDAVTEIQTGLSTLDAAGVRTAVGLASANLDTQLGDLPTNAELATALASADDATLAAIAALNNLSAAQVNAEVVDALNVDTYAEPGQGAPAATASLVAKLGYLYKAWRNRHTQTASQYSLYADDATTVDQKATVADDGTTASRTEIASGP